MSLPIGGFMPLPLPMMIPFMAAQSAAMAQAFGTYFQYGKRHISSMSNEEFNKLTPQKMHEELTADIRAMIPSLATSMHTYDSSMTPQIIKEFSEIAKSAISESTTQVVNTIGGGLELGVETSKGQINEFIAALTTWIISMSQTQGQFEKTIVQQQDISVQDIELETKKEKIPEPEPDTSQAEIQLQTSQELKLTTEQKTFNEWEAKHTPLIIDMQKKLGSYKAYIKSVQNVMIKFPQNATSVNRYNILLKQKLNAFITSKRHYTNFLSLSRNESNSLVRNRLTTLNKFIPPTPKLYKP